MAQINFPTATSNGQTFEADNGVIYTYVGTPPNGFWSGSFQATGLTTLDARFLKLDSSNDPITGGLNITSGNVGIGVSAPTEKLDVSGNIKVSGTVDGRDIAADGAKLDGIEANATGDQTASEILTLIKTVDGSGSGLDADTLDGLGSTHFTNASNLSTGTINDSRIPDVISPVTRVVTSEIRTGNGTQLVLNAGESDGKIAGQTGELVYVNAENGLRVSTPSVANWGSGYVEQRTNILGNGIYFHHNTTAVGEIGASDATWLRINQNTNKNIYTPRFIRADGGFFVDGTTKGINGSGNFVGGTIGGASDYNTLLRSNTNDTASGRIVFSHGNNVTAGSTGAQGSIEILQSTGNKDAFMAFHIAGDFATYFGLDGSTNDLFTGGWSDGGTKHRVWHAGNDGSGSGLDADKVDGIQASSFLRSDATDTATGTITFNGTVNFRSAVDLADNDILRFGSGDDFEMFCNGSHMYMDLNGGIGNLYIRDGTTTRYTFDDNGSFTASSNITAYSDISLKENIETIPNALDKVLALRGVSFNRKDVEDKPRQIGVIAQEIEEVIPEVVMTGEEGIKSVAYGNLVGLLIESIKELKAEINELKAQLEG